MSEIEYLSKFWKHKEGDTINSNGETFFIINIDDVYNDQILLSNNEISYIQDVYWNPSLEECVNSVCEFLSIKVYKDQLVYNTLIKPYPQNFKEFSEYIADFRSFILNKF